MKTLPLMLFFLFLFGISDCVAQSVPLPSSTPVPPVNARAERQPTGKLRVKASKPLAEFKDDGRIVSVYLTALRTDETGPARFQLKVLLREWLWNDDEEAMLKSVTGYVNGKPVLLLNTGSDKTTNETLNIAAKTIIRTQNFAIDLADVEIGDAAEIRNLSISVKNINLEVMPDALRTFGEFISEEKRLDEN